MQKFNEKNLPVARNIPVKTRNTAGTGHGVAAGVKFRDRTRTRMTRDRDTTGLPVPMFNPTNAHPKSPMIFVKLNTYKIW